MSKEITSQITCNVFIRGIRDRKYDMQIVYSRTVPDIWNGNVHKALLKYFQSLLKYFVKVSTGLVALDVA